MRIIKTVLFRRKAKLRIQRYADNYKNYYQNLYQDGGIFWEEQILDYYEKESKKRHREIVKTIEKLLSNSIISYQNNETFIRWKSKIIIIKFSDLDDETRVVEDLEIR